MADTPKEQPRKTHRQPSVNWNMWTVLAPVLLSVVAWSISIEVRMSKMDSAMDLSQRIKNVEDLMVPMLVDWKVQQEMKKLGALPNPVVIPVPAEPPKSHDELKKKAQSWAESQVRQSNRPPERFP